MLRPRRGRELRDTRAWHPRHDPCLTVSRTTQRGSLATDHRAPPLCLSHAEWQKGAQPCFQLEPFDRWPGGKREFCGWHSLGYNRASVLSATLTAVASFRFCRPQFLTFGSKAQAKCTANRGAKARDPCRLHLPGESLNHLTRDNHTCPLDNRRWRPTLGRSRQAVEPFCRSGRMVWSLWCVRTSGQTPTRPRVSGARQILGKHSFVAVSCDGRCRDAGWGARICIGSQRTFSVACCA